MAALRVATTIQFELESLIIEARIFMIQMFRAIAPRVTVLRSLNQSSISWAAKRLRSMRWAMLERNYQESARPHGHLLRNFASLAVAQRTRQSKIPPNRLGRNSSFRSHKITTVSSQRLDFDNPGVSHTLPVTKSSWWKLKSQP